MGRTFKTGITFILLLIPFQFLALHSADRKYASQVAVLRDEILLKDRMIIALENRLNPPKAVPLKSVIHVQGVSPIQLQNALKRAGHYLGPCDGVLTDRVVIALKEYQRSKDLQADGVLGRHTWKFLSEEKSS